MEEIIQKKIPCAVDIERSLIGCLLYDPAKIPEIDEIISSDDFYDLKYRIIYSTLLELSQNKVTISIPLLQEELKLKNVKELTSNELYKGIMADVTSSIYAESYAKKIKEKAILRALLNNCQLIEEKIYQSENKVDEVLEYTEDVIFKTLKSKRVTEFKTIAEVLLNVVDMIEENAKHKDNLTGVNTGFIDLNNRTGGLQNSDLILIAARPSMGKTAFCLNLAKSAALSGTTTAIFSLEMSSEQLGNRLLAMESGISASRLRRGRDILTDEWTEILNSSERLIGAKLLIDDTGSITIGELRSKCRKAKLEHNLGLVIIDYLQLMSGRGKENRQQEISEISRGLKLLAKELNVPVVALSQLSRACEARADHHPMLSDLRESGAIEQDADVVMFLYRDEYYNEQTEDKGIAEVIIAKQRNGSTGTVRLGWIAEQTRFVDLEQ